VIVLDGFDLWLCSCDDPSSVSTLASSSRLVVALVLN